jgi:hypothetical protein
MLTEMNPELLKVPVAIQIALAAGYLAYLVAYAGIRQHHTAADATFKSIIFSTATSAVLLWKPFVPYVNEAVAVLAALACGLVWRSVGIKASQSVLRSTGISWADDVPNAWLTITALRTDLRPSQIAVDIEGGRTLCCDDTTVFADAPYGPCVYGLDGSIAFYVTAERRPDGRWTEHTDIRTTQGDRLTYVPASAIKRVEIRNWRKPSGRAETEAGSASGPVEVEADS